MNKIELHQVIFSDDTVTVTKIVINKEVKAECDEEKNKIDFSCLLPYIGEMIAVISYCKGLPTTTTFLIITDITKSDTGYILHLNNKF